MPIIDEIKEQQEKIKNKNMKSKLSYFWDYYKVHTIVILAVILAVSIFISDLVKGPENCIIHALMLNGYPSVDTDELMNEFLTENGYDPSDATAYLEGNLTYTVGSTDNDTVSTMQKFLVMAQAGSLDFLIANLDIINYYSDQMLFYDLRDILPADMLQEYDKAGYLIYAQMDSDSSELSPVGIKGEAFPKLMATGAYDADANPVIAAISTSARTDNMLQFLHYIEQKE